MSVGMGRLDTGSKDYYNCALDPGWPALKDNLPFLAPPWTPWQEQVFLVGLASGASAPHRSSSSHATHSKAKLPS